MPHRTAAAVSLFSSLFPFLLPLSFPCYDCFWCLSIRVWGHSHKTEIETDMDMKLDWRELPDKKASRILISHPADFDNKDKWSEQFDWAMDVALKMKNAFKKYL